MDEAVNAGLNCFKILDDMYQHDTTQHGYVFRGVAGLVQLSLKNGDPLFEVNYKTAFC